MLPLSPFIFLAENILNKRCKHSPASEAGAAVIYNSNPNTLVSRSKKQTGNKSRYKESTGAIPNFLA